MRRLSLWTLLACAVFSLHGCIRQDGGDHPSPPPVPEQVDAGLQARVFQMLMADIYAEAKTKMELGEFKDQRQVGEWVSGRRSEAYEQAFGPVMDEFVNNAENYQTYYPPMFDRWSRDLRRAAQ